MNNLELREVQKSDYVFIENMICQEFHLERYIPHKRALNIVKKHYIYSCLSEQTYSRVAVKNGQIVGVIMGNASYQYSLIKHLHYLLITLFYQIIMLLWRNQGFQEFKHMHHIYKQLLENHSHEFDGVLTLFIVDHHYQGLGIGTKLMKDMMVYYQQNHIRNIYLFTDSTCNYYYYEDQGFHCLEEKEFHSQVDIDINVYLYGFQFQ